MADGGSRGSGSPFFAETRGAARDAAAMAEETNGNDEVKSILMANRTASSGGGTLCKADEARVFAPVLVRWWFECL
jgi:hypothetical protein